MDALEGVKIKGEVTEIGSSAIPRGADRGQQASTTNTANQAKDFKVTVTLKDPPPALRPGLNATADITTDTQGERAGGPHPGGGGAGGEQGGQGRGPRRAPGRPESDPARRRPREKGEEKEGVFVVTDGQGRPSGP